MLFRHFGHGDGKGRAAECFDERRVHGVKRTRSVDERGIGFLGTGRELLG
jgi:hypothetical protein